nr:hypothetical protein [Rhodoferax sp.]
MDLNCPQCKSENTQRLSTAFESGLSHVNTSSKGVGIGVGPDGIGVGVGTASTTGTSQTVASQRAAPPAKMTYLKPLAGIFVLALVLVLVASAIWKPLGFFAQLFWVVGSVLYVYRAYQFNSKSWPVLLQEWQNTFLCNRCNHVFLAN